MAGCRRPRVVDIDGVANVSITPPQPLEPKPVPLGPRCRSAPVVRASPAVTNHPKCVISTGMDRVRRMIRTRMTGGILAVVLAYALLLQGLVGTYAQATMATAGPATAICSHAGTTGTGGDHPLKDLAHDCCSAACQATCAIGAALTPGCDLGPVFHALPSPAWRPHPDNGKPPRSLGLVREARGPPSFSA